MFIKRLEVFGFKSFKNRTVLEFDNHEFIGIVGPNGCGKSNVVDALLWVMGESSPKHLRGESLSDVIFSGTTKEPQGNLAEVILTLNSGDTGFPESYKEFSELTVSRRSFRDGKNEYFINKRECLLRDIREFFMNTGAGCRGFSIIEQEAIERLITAKPLQRRFIIEEVAGITKFKNRKNESVGKLELVNQNLERLKDVLKIQESQLSRLTSQAKTAEKYKKLKQEIESRQKQIERREQENLFCSYQKLKEDQERLVVEKQKMQQDIQSAEKQTAEEKDNIKKTRERIKEAKVHIEKLQQVIVDKKMEEAVWLDKMKAIEMIENIKSKKRVLEEKKKKIQEDLTQIQSFFKDKMSVEEFEESARRIQEDRNEVIQYRKEAEINRDSLKKQTRFVQKEVEVLVKEKSDIQEQIQKSINDKNAAVAFLNKHSQTGSALSRKLVDFCKREENLEGRKQSLSKQLNQLNQSVSVLKHRAEEMQKLISRFETLNEGADELIKWNSEEFQPVFQKLEVDSEYAGAFGVVLGPYIQALVLQNDTTGIEQAVQRLKDQNKGKTGFLSSLPGLSVSSASREEMRAYPALICFLDEKIKWNIHIDSLRPLLEQTAVVSDLRVAFELKRQFPAFQFVTKEGDLVTRDSFVYAGSSDKETSLFQIRDQIAECSREVSEKEIQLKVKTVELESCKERLEQTQKDKQNLQNQSVKNSENLISINKDIEHKEKDILRLSLAREKNEERIKGFEDEKQNLMKYEEACNKEIQSLQETLSHKEARLQALQEARDEYKAQSLRKSRWEAELLDNNRNRKSLDQETALLFKLMNKFNRGRDKKGEKVLESVEEGFSELDFESERGLVREQREKLEKDLSAFQESREQNSQLEKEQEENLKSWEHQIFQIKLDINKLESERDKKEMERVHLRDKFLENYQSQIDDFVSLPEDIPLDKLKEEINRYREQLECIKEVNFLALEEYEHLSKENFFLNEQKEDLFNSRKEILKVISHVDKLCETRFNDMLEEINKRFSKVFPIVFRGGDAKAQLILHEEPEGREPGVDILIHPPGKKPQSVNLLSRGEKALTSVCLIYSLFLVKPSPFCIIDEVDAPLDDANIFRFLSVLREMSRKSQIIVITHNKYTMQACRKLYGVTMKRPGISQIVSVDIKEPELSP